MASATSEDREFTRNEVSQILNVLNQSRIPYAVWGSAACVYHGGQWLWQCPDYEILIKDGSDGELIRRAMDVITARCHPAWEYDRSFDQVAWSNARGDGPPRFPLRRFRNNNYRHDGGFGVILVPSMSCYVTSMHHDDLVNEEDDPIWIYPSLKNFVETQIGLWSLQRRNSSLLELADVVGANRLNEQWASEVGLEVSNVRRTSRAELPTDREIWDEIVRMALTNSDRQRATARFAARKAERQAREDQANNGTVEGQVGSSGNAAGGMVDQQRT